MTISEDKAPALGLHTSDNLISSFINSFNRTTDCSLDSPISCITSNHCSMEECTYASSKPRRSRIYLMWAEGDRELSYTARRVTFIHDPWKWLVRTFEEQFLEQNANSFKPKLLAVKIFSCSVVNHRKRVKKLRPR